MAGYTSASKSFSPSARGAKHAIGGKRFAVQQELVATTTSAAINKIDLAAICGKDASVFVNAIGNTGAGR